MPNEMGKIAVPKIEAPIEWKEFLETQPPGKQRSILNVGIGIPSKWAQPLVKLYCDSKDCQGDHFFEPIESSGPITTEWSATLLHYRCKHCESKWKIFAVMGRVKDPRFQEGEATKFGELPLFGPHIPPKVITLIREDREIFTKGCRAES